MSSKLAAVLCVILLAVTCRVGMADDTPAKPLVVSIVKTETGHQVLRNGEPFFVKAADGQSAHYHRDPGSGNPQVTLTHVPQWRSEQDLQGRVTGVDPAAHHIALYIYVGGWWTKPTFEKPTVSIKPDGSWTADITTGTNDTTATKIAAFLLPATVVPPRANGQKSLPKALGGLALASAMAERQDITDRKTYRRMLDFSGYRWSVKAWDVPVGPGPNPFSDSKEHVWVDDRGLHLTIRKREGQWYCTEVILQESFGYGTYVFQTRCRPDRLDPYVVAGFFTWETEAPYPHRELDFEYARWGKADDPTNAQFVIQPYQTPGHLLRYRIEPTDADSDLTHVLVWSKGRVEFTTARGHHPPERIPQGSIISAWTHASEGVPEPGNENIRINLWLDRGHPPQSGEPIELLLTGFSYSPPPQKALAAARRTPVPVPSPARERAHFAPLSQIAVLAMLPLSLYLIKS